MPQLKTVNTISPKPVYLTFWLFLFIAVFLLLPTNALAAVIGEGTGTPNTTSGNAFNISGDWLSTPTVGTMEYLDFYAVRYRDAGSQPSPEGTDMFTAYVTAGDFGAGACTMAAKSATELGVQYSDSWPPPTPTTMATFGPFVGDCDFVENDNRNVVYELSSSSTSGWQTGTWTDSGNALFVAYDTAPPPDNTQTRIIEVFPPDDYPDFLSPYATSTVFDIEADIFVNAEDFVEGMVFKQRVFNNVAAASSAAGPSFSEGGNILCDLMWDWLCPPIDSDAEYSGYASFTVEYEIPSAGAHSFATTTEILAIGRYTMVSTITANEGGWFSNIMPGADIIVAELMTRFLVVENSMYDDIVGDTIQSVQDLQNTATGECSLTPSGMIAFLQACTAVLFVPTVEQNRMLISSLYSEILTIPPIGYLTRFVVLLAGEYEPTMPPPIEYTFGSSSPQSLQGKTYSMQVFEHLDEFNSIEADDGSGMDAWDVIMPLIKFSVALAVTLVVIDELGRTNFAGMRFGSGRGSGGPGNSASIPGSTPASGRVRKAADGTRYREYTNKDARRMIRKGERNGVIH